MPDSYALTHLGDLFMVNGFDPPLKWDAQAGQTQTVGVLPPSTACTLALSGTGALVGTYYGYVRFLDAKGNPSNLSPISAELIGYNSTGTITDATFATPIVITSASHGLTTGRTVKIEGVGGNTAANATWVITVLTANTFSLDESEGNASYTGSGTWSSGGDTITYTNVPVPVEAKVVRRQLLRNTDGQGITFYVDVDTTDLTSTTLTSTKDDETLANQTAVPLLDARGDILANQYTVPPTHKSVIAAHQDRMFMAVDAVYDAGSVKVTAGSTTVTGVGTGWTASLDDRYVYIEGASKVYQISSVDTSAQTLTLDAPWLDATDNFCKYAIRPAPGERRLIYYTPAGVPEGWPATNALSVQEDNDEITGLMAKGSYLYILERLHTYRFTFQSDPARDGAIFLAANRGCINHRCWVLVGDTAYCLDEQGIHAFGGQQPDPISQPIQDLFRGDGINWKASRWFHAVHYATQETIRWFVCMEGDWYPRHCLTFNYRLKRWWLERYPYKIGGSCSGQRRGEQKVYLGAEAQKVLALWTGYLDGVDPGTGTTRGTATSATLLTLTDSTAAFPSACVGAPLCIVDGKGKGQVRQVTARLSATQLEVKHPWTDHPDNTSVYQLGGISWTYMGSSLKLATSEEMAERKVELMYSRTVTPGIMTMRLRYDFADEPIEWKTTREMNVNDGVGMEAESPDIEIDQTRGFVGFRIPGGKEFHANGPRYVQAELEGVSNQDPFSVNMLTFYAME